MRIGLIGRADNGGLGNLTVEFARHLRPAKTLVLDLGNRGRGVSRPERYGDLNRRIVYGVTPSADDIAWLLDGIDVLYTAETWYHENIPGLARDAGVATVLHAMPELHRPWYEADEIWLPTIYRSNVVYHQRVVPVPVALDQFTYRERTSMKHVVHVGAPAMLDRNGSNALLAALQLMDNPVHVTFVSPTPPDPTFGNLTVTWQSTTNEPYYTIWPDDADLLVLPRRFAGLCLPVQEAAAQGIPAVMPGVEPQSTWPVTCFGVDPPAPYPYRMAGGMIDVWTPDSKDLARVLNELVLQPERMPGLSRVAREWAESLSWGIWANRYRAMFAEVVENTQ